MTEYIEREAALDICQKEYKERLKMLDYCGDTVAWNIGGAIKGLPAADVAPVVHGRWEIVQTYGKTTRYQCTACKSEMVDYINREGYHRYCHRCGAKMDLKE